MFQIEFLNDYCPEISFTKLFHFLAIIDQEYFHYSTINFTILKNSEASRVSGRLLTETKNYQMILSSPKRITTIKIITETIKNPEVFILLSWWCFIACWLI